MKIVLETPRLILRQFTVEDALAIQQLNSAPDVLKYIHEPALENVAQAKEVLINIILPQYKNKLGRWAIHTKQNSEFIGWCGLKHLPDTNEIDLGYRLRPACWGSGYATEAAQHTLLYGLNKLNLQEIIGKAHIDNIASQRVLEKIEMKFKREIIEDNVQVKVYSITKSQLKS
jgi:RimJ/RimL family protein N-acetyltransferase